MMMTGPFLWGLCTFFLVVDGRTTRETLKANPEGDMVSTPNLVAYLCDDMKPATKAINLLEPGKCAAAKELYHSEETVRVQVLQTDTSSAIEVGQCRVKALRRVTRCGFTGITYGGKWSAFHESVRVSPEACAKALKTGWLDVEGEQINITLGAEIGHTWFSRGNVLPDGGCEVVPGFTSRKGEDFYKSYEEVGALIYVRKTVGLLDPVTNMMGLPGEVEAGYFAGNAYDEDQGTLTWEVARRECAASLSQLYLGPAPMQRKITTRGTDPNEEALVLIEPDDNNPYNHYQFAGFQLREATNLCGTHCYRTQEGKLAVCLFREHDNPLPGVSFKTEADQTRLLFATQASYLHFDTNRRTENRFRAVQADICNSERKTLQGRLHRIAAESDPYALQDIFGPGHDLLRAGAAVYLTKCPTVDVVRVRHTNCSQEVPVKLANDSNAEGATYFMDPISRILRDRPTIIPCSPVTPVRWFLDGIWVCDYGTHSSPCAAPLDLPTNTTPFQAEDWTRGLGGSIYSPEQQHQHRLFQQALHARRPVAAQVAFTAVTNDDQGTLPGVLIDAKSVDMLTDQLGLRLLPFFRVLGDWWSSLTGLFLLICILKYLINSIFRAIQTFRRHGFSWLLLLALWHAAHDFVMLPLKITEVAAAVIARDRQGAPDEEQGLVTGTVEGHPTGGSNGTGGSPGTGGTLAKQLALPTATMENESQGPNHREHQSLQPFFHREVAENQLRFSSDRMRRGQSVRYTRAPYPNLPGDRERAIRLAELNAGGRTRVTVGDDNDGPWGPGQSSDHYEILVPRDQPDPSRDTEYRNIWTDRQMRAQGLLTGARPRRRMASAPGGAAAAEETKTGQEASDGDTAAERNV